MWVREGWRVGKGQEERVRWSDGAMGGSAKSGRVQGGVAHGCVRAGRGERGAARWGEGVWVVVGRVGESGGLREGMFEGAGGREAEWD